MNDFHRGEIYYISRGGATPRGSEQYPDRPAVIVSNERNNEHSSTVEIVYLTTQPKTDLPTHATIRSTGRVSTVLCEQVYTVSTERVGTYIGQASETEMQNIDIALMISLQLDGDAKTHNQYNETIKRQQEEIDSLKSEIETLQQECDDRIAEIEQNAAVYVEENKKISDEHIRRATEQVEWIEEQAKKAPPEDIIKIKTERDTYKAMYESLLEKVMRGGAA